MMRTFAEVQRAHDVLHSQITGGTPFVMDESARLPMTAALDVLCWVLRHDHSNGFPRALAQVEALLKSRGFVFVEDH